MSSVELRLTLLIHLPSSLAAEHRPGSPRQSNQTKSEGPPSLGGRWRINAPHGGLKDVPSR
jgi:hypothetical protein